MAFFQHIILVLNLRTTIFLILAIALMVSNAANILKDKTCLKSLDNPSCIDLFITNRPRPLFPQAYQIFIKLMLLPSQHFSVKHFQKKCFTVIIKTLSKINSNMNLKTEFEMNQLNAI